MVPSSPPGYRQPAMLRSAPDTWSQRLGRSWRRLWELPDPELVDAGQRGEWLIAGIRLLIIGLLSYIPLQHFLEQPDEPGRQMALWLAAAAVAEALVVFTAVRRSWGRGWIGFFSGLLDVSLVTLALWFFLRLDRPLEATGDLLLFPVYLLAIGATSLRYDWRICALTGVAAFAQYAALVFYAAWQWDLGEANSGFSWWVQCGRLALLAVATLLSTSLVLRARELRSLSTRDRLTDLANRGFFDESLGRLEALAARADQAVTVAMIDIDHFKVLNDSLGHLAGDRALRHVADMLSRSVRGADLVARYGGEEFAGLFPGMAIADADRRMEELRQAVAQTPPPLEGRGKDRQLTISIGFAVWPGDGRDLQEALAVADRRLYQAKKGGRNRVVGPGQDPVRPQTLESQRESQQQVGAGQQL